LLTPFVNLHDSGWGAAEDFAASNAANGLFVIATKLNLDLLHLAEACRNCDSRMVLGFRVNIANPDLAFIREAAAITPHLAMASSDLNEWSPTTPVWKWANLAEKVGATWHCTLIHICLLNDLEKFALRDSLVEHNVEVWCLCGYMLARYCCCQSLPNYKTSLMTCNLGKRYGLTLPALREWCEPLEINSGAGGPGGLRRGTESSCLAAGFKGCVASGPWPTGQTISLPPKPFNESPVYSELVESWK
jgi:hypothetical protein